MGEACELENGCETAHKLRADIVEVLLSLSSFRRLAVLGFALITLGLGGWKMYDSFRYVAIENCIENGAMAATVQKAKCSITREMIYEQREQSIRIEGQVSAIALSQDRTDRKLDLVLTELRNK